MAEKKVKGPLDREDDFNGGPTSQPDLTRSTGRGTTQGDINNWFTYHPPKDSQVPRYEVLRDEFKRLAELILELTPSCPDQTAALRKLRDTSMAVNQAIACNE